MPISQLSDELDRRAFGYLISVGDDRRSHVVALRPRVNRDGGAVVLRFVTESRRAASNIGTNADVTVVFPPVDGGVDGMSLIVDGTATPGPGCIDVAPTWAVLHRAAPPIGEGEAR